MAGRPGQRRAQHPYGIEPDDLLYEKVSGSAMPPVPPAMRLDDDSEVWAFGVLLWSLLSKTSTSRRWPGTYEHTMDQATAYFTRLGSGDRQEVQRWEAELRECWRGDVAVVEEQWWVRLRELVCLCFNTGGLPSARLSMRCGIIRLTSLLEACPPAPASAAEEEGPGGPLTSDDVAIAGLEEQLRGGGLDAEAMAEALVQKAELHRARGEKKKAHECLEDACGIEGVPATARVDYRRFEKLAISCRERHKHARSLEHYQTALAKLQAAFPSERGLVGSLVGSIGLVFKEQRDFEQAEEWLKRALKVKEQALGTDHVNLAFTHTDLGNMYSILGKVEDAREHLDRALQLRRAALAPTDPLLATSLGNLARVYNMTGDLQQAAALLKQALDVLRPIRPMHAHVPLLLSNLAELHGKMGHHREAVEYGNESIAIKRATLERNHGSLAVTLTNVGQWHVKLGEVEEGVSKCEEALKIREADGNCAPRDLAIAKHGLAFAYKAQGRRQEALRLSEEAVTLFERSDLPLEHSERQAACEQLERLRG